MTLHPALRSLLWPASLLFHLLVRLRAWLYGRGILRQRRLQGVVLSVGNLTVGGTGKTPMVLWLAQRLIAEGKRVAILTQGYRGFRGPASWFPQSKQNTREGLSDELCLLRTRLGDRVEFGVGADRYSHGCQLHERGVDWFVLDDGFQHLRLARDVDIVLIDATEPFGGGRLLPAGGLREPKSALPRADIVVITRSSHARAVEATVRRSTHAPIFYAQVECEDILPFMGNVPQQSEVDWREKKLFAFSAVGNPAAFFSDLRRWGMQLAGQASYRDHHWYTRRDVEQLERRAQAAGAQAFICTEKDLFNLAGIPFQVLPALYCRVALKISEADKFWQAILATVERRRGSDAP